MSLTILRTQDADLNRVQQNVKSELDAIQGQIPAKKTPVTPITADYSVKLTDVLVLATPVTDINVTLPVVSTCVGQSFTVKNKSTDAVVHMRGQYVGGAFQLVDGVAPYDVPGGAGVTCYSTGSAWEII